MVERLLKDEQQKNKVKGRSTMKKRNYPGGGYAGRGTTNSPVFAK
jgi:hypothetical protein